MDSRRLPRTVVDPKVRRVGFFTAVEPPPARSQSFPVDTGGSTNADGTMISSPTKPELSVGGVSFSPVMIPPHRYASADGLPALGRAAATAAPVSIHSPQSPLRRDVIQIPVGSFNPSEYMLGTSAMLSPSSSRFDDLEFLDEVSIAAGYGKKGKEVAPFLGSSEEMAMAVRSGGNAPTKSALTTASVVKTLPGVTDFTLNVGLLTSQGSLFDLKWLDQQSCDGPAAQQPVQLPQPAQEGPVRAFPTGPGGAGSLLQKTERDRNPAPLPLMPPDCSQSSMVGPMGGRSCHVEGHGWGGLEREVGEGNGF